MRSDPQTLLSNTRAHPLLTIINSPNNATAFNSAQWRTAFSAAYLTRTMGVVARQCGELSLAPRVRRWVDGTSVQMRYNSRNLLLELDDIVSTFSNSTIPVMALKGGAYAALGLPVSEFRVSNDIDLMVPGERIDETEKFLRARGWKDDDVTISPLDREYYKRWLHEIPPLANMQNSCVIDLHHMILPRTDRRCFDPQPFWDAAVESPIGILVPCPSDLILHSTAHLFRNGRFHTGVRDLYDIHLLVDQYKDLPGFWTTLIERAELVGLQRPCAFVLRYINALFDTQIPKAIDATANQWLPSWVGMMDVLVDWALLPRQTLKMDRRRELALWILSHQPLPRFRVVATWLFWAKRFSKPLEEEIESAH